jgi:negative regulator of sigma E activity
MSLLSVTPSTRDRTTRIAPKPELPRPGAPRLRVVRDHDRPAPAPAPRRSPSPLRLTRRGRVLARLAVAALVLLAVVAGVLLIDRSAAADSQAHPIPVSYRVVLPGETLWQIAGEVAPGTDRRDTVARIKELNALDTAAVNAGQRIAVPVASAP